MTQVQQVHFRLLERFTSLGRVRTVQAKPRPDPLGGPFKPIAASTIELNRKIVELHAAGMKNFEIAEALGVTRTTVGYHLKGRCSTAAKAARRQ